MSALERQSTLGSARARERVSERALSPRVAAGKDVWPYSLFKAEVLIGFRDIWAPCSPATVKEEEKYERRS